MRPPARGGPKQISDLVLQDPVGREPDRLTRTFGFEELVDTGLAKAKQLLKYRAFQGN